MFDHTFGGELSLSLCVFLVQVKQRTEGPTLAALGKSVRELQVRPIKIPVSLTVTLEPRLVTLSHPSGSS